MTNHATILRSLVIYGICLPLAVLLGYLLTDPDLLLRPDNATFGTMGILFAILMIPILLRFHHTFLVASWNLSAVLFFLPGRPNLSLALCIISFMICVGHRTLDKRFRFLPAPEITRPLIAMVIIVIITAEVTGGIGIRSMGSDVYGGKRYVLMIGIIMGYFAFISKRIPVEKAHWYLALFFLPGLTSFIQDFSEYSGPLKPIFAFFPPNILGAGEFGVTRFSGLSTGASVVFFYMLARYGIKGVFTTDRPLRFMLFIVCSSLALFGGYRSVLISFLLAFGILFFLEGSHRTKLLPIFIFGIVSTTALTLPFIQRLPPTIQRSLAFIPQIPIDPDIRLGTEASSNWRVRMWKVVLPEVPRYLLVGKGFGMSAQDFNYAVDTTLSRDPTGDDFWGALAAGDYHNGPLSVIMTFGIWGMLAFLWFIAGGVRVLYNNYRYGDVQLKLINTFLFAYFLAKCVMFFLIVGGIPTDMITFLGILGLSVSLNGGVVRAPKVVPAPAIKVAGLANLLPRPKSAFSR